ncbi:MAG: MBL fold metallo-hydrolase [Johnsonella sp.]|nr:MBL fold metallo-hydrolase [Johnsonella sp.]
MILEFIGADHEVTGSCHYLECAGTKLLVDYGMEQGINVFENAPLPVAPAELDAVLLTHAHIDHAGLLPLLFAHGFRGRIITTNASKALSNIMLKDSAHIQEAEADWRNRKALRAGTALVTPLYTMQDAIDALKLFEGFDYGEIVEIGENIRARFIDAGHLLGSASIEVWLKEGEVQKKIVFSGDIGNFNKPLIKDPQYIKEADYVVMESTYGDRYHKPGVDHSAELAKIMQKTFDRGGNVVIPAFAVGRTQELLYFIRRIKQEGMIKGHEGFEVYVDSPLAAEAISVFRDNLMDCLDEETRELVKAGISPIAFAGLKTAVSLEESQQINFNPNPKVIISASGMCDAGRIRHHLKHNLWREDSTIVFAGYQSVGTLGRTLQDGSESVKLFGDSIMVNAAIETLESISSHADKGGLEKWISAFSPKPEAVFIVHGEDSVCEGFEKNLREEFGIHARAPFSGSIFDLANGVWIKETIGVPISKEVEKNRRESGVYLRLIAAGERLNAVIKSSKGGSNKDLAKFADQINALCDKWMR